jgi:hypothetical protein
VRELASITQMLVKCSYNLYGKLPSMRKVKYLEKFHLERDVSQQQNISHSADMIVPVDLKRKT